MKKHLEETVMLNFSHKRLQQLVERNGWRAMDPTQQVGAIYNFVQNKIVFGYNKSDAIAASQVLEDGYGQCNTKTTLLMALFRAVGLPCRLHGSTIKKALQKGAIQGLWYQLAPAEIVHCWTEVYVDGAWYGLEGVILDRQYLQEVQKKFQHCGPTFCGFGVFTNNLQNPPIEWDKNDTFIQNKGVHQDFGIFDNPDQFFARHRQKLNFIRRVLFKYWIRFRMNNNVDRIRKLKSV